MTTDEIIAALIFGKTEGGGDGKSAFIRYSSNADGSGMTETWSAGQNYIGFMTGEEATSDNSDYTWSLFKGDSGNPSGNILQTTGTSTTDTMSQKAITEETDSIKADLSSLHFKTDLTDGKTYLYMSGEKTDAALKFADAVIQNQEYDTIPYIEEYGKSFNDANIQNNANMCHSGLIPIPPERGKLVAFRSNASGKSESGAYSTWFYDDDGYLSYSNTYRSNTEYSAPVPETATGFKFAFITSEIDDCYAYDDTTGLIYFAGKNTAYSGKKYVNDKQTTILNSDNLSDFVNEEMGLAIDGNGELKLEINGISAGIGIKLSETAIESATYATNPKIAEIGTALGDNGTYRANKDACYTDIYPLKNNAPVVVYLADSKEISWSGYKDIWFTVDGEYASGKHATILTSNSENILGNDTSLAGANGFMTTLAAADIDDSYAYDSMSGDIYFAGKNTAYYGKKNISDVSPDKIYENKISASWVENANTVVQTVKEKIDELDGDCIPFAVQTDLHGRNPYPANYFRDKLPNAMMIMLGDYVADYYRTDQLDNFAAIIGDVPASRKIISVVGNHDVNVSNNSTELPTWRSLLGYMKSSKRRLSGQFGNYTVKDDDHNIKYICLQPYDFEQEGHYDDMPARKFHTRQMDWLVSELSVPDGYDIVIINHEPFITGTDTKNRAGTSADSTTPTTVDASMWEMFSARKEKESGTVIDHDGETHSYDFSGLQGEFLCILNGHMHEEFITEHDGIVAYISDQFTNPQFCCTAGVIDRNNRKLYIYRFTASQVYDELEIDI